MSNLFAILVLVSLVAFVVFLVKLIIKKIKGQPLGNLVKLLVLSVVVCLVSFVLTGITYDSELSRAEQESAPAETVAEATTEVPETEVSETVAPETTEEVTTEAAVDEAETLKKELKEEYGVDPHPFAKNDKTGKWRVSTVANATPPSDYAVKYAKAYMTAGDVHFIVNFSLKTTTQFSISGGILEARTTEYVEKEEHDAQKIGEGMEYTNCHFKMDTGEEITTDVDPNAGTVTGEELIADVTEAIKGSVGSGEKISGVTFDGSDLKVTVDMSGADTSILPVNLIAEGRVSSITESILALDDAHYNSWTTITVDFGKIGTITLDKSSVKDEGYGKFFDFAPNCFG